MIVDAHLDLAFSAMIGRDLTRPLAEIRAQDTGRDVAMVNFEELRRAGVGLACGTLFAMPQTEEAPFGYADWSGAREQAVRQLDIYRRWEDAGHIQLLRNGAEVREHVAHWAPETSPLGVILLMEGADPLKDPDDLHEWAAAGVRLIGPAWGRTRYAGGTDAPGPLSDMGQELLVAMRELNVALDASHLADQAFWPAVEVQPKVIASHSNARALVPTDRHLSDDMARAIGARGGVVGLVLFNKFLSHAWDHGDPRLDLGELRRHAEHLAELVGWERVGLGSDFDGGFGLEAVPRGLERVADLERFFEHLPDEAQAGVRGGNWQRWLEANL